MDNRTESQVSTMLIEPPTDKKPGETSLPDVPANTLSHFIADVKEEKYKFIAYAGNHSEVVAEALHRRGNFEEVPDKIRKT